MKNWPNTGELGLKDNWERGHYLEGIKNTLDFFYKQLVYKQLYPIL